MVAYPDQAQSDPVVYPGWVRPTTSGRTPASRWRTPAGRVPCSPPQGVGSRSWWNLVHCFL